MTHLFVEGTRTSGKGLAFVVGLPNLRALSLGSPLMSAEDLRQLSKATKLEELYLDRMPVDRTVASAIAGLANLRILSLRGTAITDGGLQELRSLSHLTELRLDGTAITNEGLAACDAWPDLEVLTLSGTRVSDAGLKPLNNCRKLTTLSVDHTGCTLSGVADTLAGNGLGLSEALPVFVDVEFNAKGAVISLDLKGVRFRDQDVRLLKKLSKLEWFIAPGCELSDAGAVELAELPLAHLKLININYASISDQGLRSLCSISGLESLHVAGTRVTEEAVAEIQQTHPGLRIYTTDLEAARRKVSAASVP